MTHMKSTQIEASRPGQKIKIVHSLPNFNPLKEILFILQPPCCLMSENIEDSEHTF